MDDIKRAMEAKKNAFEHKCYEAYELRWMIAHGNTLQEFVDTLGDIAAESVEEDAMCAVTDGESAKSLIDDAHDAFVAILFLDEFDAIAKKRDDSNELGELKRVVTTLLQNFDNMPPNVFLIAATNHEQLLDPAIWRRFNVTIQLDLPDIDNRKKLIEKWFQEFDISGKFNYKTLASISEGLSCANILEWAKACGKENVLKKDFKMEDATIILIRQLTKYSNNSEDTWKVILRMKNAGVSEKNISKALGVPATTLNYQIKVHLNAGKEEEVNERSATESVDS